MRCDVSYLLLYFVGLKFLSFPVPSLHDSTQQLDGRTTDQLDQLDDLVSKTSTAYSTQANTVLRAFRVREKIYEILFRTSFYRKPDLKITVTVPL